MSNRRAGADKGHKQGQEPNVHMQVSSGQTMRIFISILLVAEINCRPRSPPPDLTVEDGKKIIHLVVSENNPQDTTIDLNSIDGSFCDQAILVNSYISKNHVPINSSVTVKHSGNQILSDIVDGSATFEKLCLPNCETVKKLTLHVTTDAKEPIDVKLKTMKDKDSKYCQNSHHKKSRENGIESSTFFNSSHSLMIFIICMGIILVFVISIVTCYCCRDHISRRLGRNYSVVSITGQPCPTEGDATSKL